MTSPCASKVFYDTEWEADQAANNVSYKFGTQMEAYACGNHWHIANTDPTKRSRVNADSQRYCVVCNSYMKRGRYQRHVTTKGHLRNVRRGT